MAPFASLRRGPTLPLHEIGRTAVAAVRAVGDEIPDDQLGHNLIACLDGVPRSTPVPMRDAPNGSSGTPAPTRRLRGLAALSGLSVVMLLVASACSSADAGPAAISSAVSSVPAVGATEPDRPIDPAPTTIPASTSTTAPTTTTPTTTTPTTTPPPTTTPYAIPLADAASAGWGPMHSGYPATDLFIACGSEIVSPVNGVAIDIRTVDSWDPAVDNPATRGGRSVAVLGDDGVRYYVAHLDEVDPALALGVRVGIGQRLGTVGRTGRTSACHVHFGISPPCPGKEWSVRRGVVGPARYLDAWRAGEQLSPVDEVAQWLVDNPTACADAMADPVAADA